MILLLAIYSPDFKLLHTTFLKITEFLRNSYVIKAKLWLNNKANNKKKHSELIVSQLPSSAGFRRIAGLAGVIQLIRR